jgi:hypothetical protein
MFKKIAIAAPLALLAMSSTAFAANEASHSISLVATVPTNSFYVVPVDPDLVNKDQDMSYNPATGKMTEVKGYFDVRNSNGSVHASLSGYPYLQSGTDQIPLDVEFNGKILNQMPQMVVGEDESDSSYRALLKIAPRASSTYAPGDYTGTIAMVFDAVPPVGSR